MRSRTSRAMAMTTLALATSVACRGGHTQPADPMLDAIRAEERQGDLSYTEGQGKHLFLHYCAACHGDEARGDGQNASNLNPPPPDMAASKTTRDTLLRKVITE